MSLYQGLQRRAAAGRPITVGVIGAGKFSAMFLAQAARTTGLHVVAVADLSPDQARQTLATVGWPAERHAARSLGEAVDRGTTLVTDDGMAVIAHPGIEVIVDITGHPSGAVDRALACVEHGKHMVNVTVEAEVLAGAALVERFRSAGLVYSQAYGDQPALIAEMVDWARTCGFDIVAAGKGTKYLPEYHYVTPAEVWGHYGLTEEEAQAGGMNPQMFNSFLDGTKSAIEMAAVANACDLAPAPDGLRFPPAGMDDLARVLRLEADGGMLDAPGRVEVVSSLNRDGSSVPRDLRWGVYVVLRAPDAYVARCYNEYGLSAPDHQGYTAMYKPFHFIGLELGMSVASAALRGEPIGAARHFRGDVVAVAKRDMAVGDTLDGEGGTTVFGRLMPAADSVAMGVLPIGLAHGVRLKRAVSRDAALTYDDVEIEEKSAAIRLRRELEGWAYRGEAGEAQGRPRP